MDLFIFKKIISLFVGSVFPAVLCIALFALISKKYPRLSRVCILFLSVTILALLSPWTSKLLVGSLEAQFNRVDKPDPSVEYVAVLSGSRGQRVVEAIRIWRLLPNAQFITTSVSVSGYYKIENNYTTEVALDLGVPKSRLLTITAVQDTQDEIKKIAEIIGNKKSIIVSSATHLPRVNLITKSFDLNVVLAPSDWISPSAPWWVFSTKSIYAVDRILHEYAGIIWYLLVHRK